MPTAARSVIDARRQARAQTQQRLSPGHACRRVRLPLEQILITRAHNLRRRSSFGTLAG